MNIDISPILHALVAITLQAIAGLLLGDWVIGARSSPPMSTLRLNTDGSPSSARVNGPTCLGMADLTTGRGISRVSWTGWFL